MFPSLLKDYVNVFTKAIHTVGVCCNQNIAFNLMSTIKVKRVRQHMFPKGKPVRGGLLRFRYIFQNKSIWAGHIRFSPRYELANRAIPFDLGAVALALKT